MATIYPEDAVAAEYRFFRIIAHGKELNRTTQDFAIRNRPTGDLLGFVKYYPSWRQHVVAPEPGTVWSAGCLDDLKDFLGRIK